MNSGVSLFALFYCGSCSFQNKRSLLKKIPIPDTSLQSQCSKASKNKETELDESSTIKFDLSCDMAYFVFAFVVDSKW